MNQPHREPQGSLWRRWDPHVHLPGTALNDQFGATTIEEALDLLASRTPAIEAVGVTDYLTTRLYRQAVAAWRKGAGDSIRLLFPNVELRFDSATGQGHGINLHLMCAPEEVDKLDRFLSQLEFAYRGTTYRSDYANLVDLGRAFRRDPKLEQAAAASAGANQFKVSFSAFAQRFRSDDWARSRCLVGVAGGEGDGTSGLRDPGGSFEALRQEMEGLVHVIFSGNPQQRAFWLGQGSLDAAELATRYGSRKLCLHGSDAHEIDRLGVPDGDRYTWLKGDATFDTLLQACIEPEMRAWIEREPPLTAQARGRIRGVSVVSPGWFPNELVPINPGLVAIIGARGSGKTALADVIAAAAGSESPFSNPTSFLSRAGSLLKDAIATVDWTDDSRTIRALGIAAQPGGLEVLPSVRYLSQQFVEHLCASDGLSDDLIAEIERVVFASWPVGQRLGATFFSELLNLRLEGARTRQATEVESIVDLSERITIQRVLQEGLAAKRKELEEPTKAIAQLAKEAKDLTTKADQTSAKRLAVVSGVLQQRQVELQKEDRKVRSLGLLQQGVRSARTVDLPRITARLRDQNGDAGLDEPTWKEFEIAFVGDVDRILAERISSAEASRSAIAGASTAPSPAEAKRFDQLDEVGLRKLTVADLQAERARLEKLAGVDTARSKRLVALSEQQGRETAKVERIKIEIQAAEAADGVIAGLSDERLDCYASYFDALLEEESELNQLYAPLAEILTESKDSVSKLRFAVRRSVDLEGWAGQGELLLDLRRDGPFRGQGALARVVAESLVTAWTTGDGAAAAAAIRKFVVRNSRGLRDQSSVDRSDPVAYRDWERRVASWLYGADHVTLNYSLEYDGVDIRRLSPGTRGIVLLLLYLAVDRAETIPLIIDQPEENLDPESIYTELVRLFREASERRQVIMVTHNANLVVNTEVDQVIVATCGALEADRLPDLRYLSGGLEEPEVRAAVCQVLEGGEAAFRDRARRLRLAL